MISPSRPNSVPRPTAAGRGFAVSCACMSPLLAQSRRPAVVDECPLSRENGRAPLLHVTSDRRNHRSRSRRPTYDQRPFSYDPAGRTDANVNENCREFLKRVRVHPPSSLRGLGISYPVSKYFVAATITHLRIARIGYWLRGTRELVEIFWRSRDATPLISI